MCECKHVPTDHWHRVEACYYCKCKEYKEAPIIESFHTTDKSGKGHTYTAFNRKNNDSS